MAAQHAARGQRRVPVIHHHHIAIIAVLDPSAVVIGAGDVVGVPAPVQQQHRLPACLERLPQRRFEFEAKQVHACLAGVLITLLPLLRHVNDLNAWQLQTGDALR
ncbi:MAG: hypothetical protein CMJ21_01865 [Phycisphaerae bacterium]|nr:hypothetical protein [Phycisphaerae bacterium]